MALVLPLPASSYDPKDQAQTRSNIVKEDRRNVKAGIPFPVPPILPHSTVAHLPSVTAYQYGLAVVTDATVTTPYTNVAGGGGNIVVVFSNGTHWVII